MRGLKISGLSFVLMTMISLVIPASSRAQGATADQYLAYANQLYTAKNYSQAAQYYAYAAKMNPNSAAACQGAGYCYYALGNKQYALAYLQKALQLNPGNTQLAQFVQNLQAQAGTAPAATAAAPAPADPLTQGSALLRQGQYAASIPYFQQVIQQNPNDYRGYYYTGYAYAYLRDSKDAALYFEVAAVKQQNAATKAYADRLRAALSPEDQQWVDNQVATYTNTAVAGAAAPAKKQTTFGFHVLGGSDYVFANPQQILNGATKGIGAGPGNPAGSVSLVGVTPSMIAVVGLEPYVQLGDNFEINLNLSYLPIGNLSYTENDLSITPQGAGDFDGYKYSYENSGMMAGLGVKVLFGGNGIKGYFGIGGDLAPISMNFTKVPIDINGTPITSLPSEPSQGTYSTMAFGAHARLGVDFSLGKDMAIGPFVGFQYLSTTKYQDNGATLVVNSQNGDVGTNADPDLPASQSQYLSPLTLDYTALTFGGNFTFSF
jgi:tetratricopeptide (TPR) repeat protein